MLSRCILQSSLSSAQLRAICHSTLPSSTIMSATQPTTPRNRKPRRRPASDRNASTAAALQPRQLVPHNLPRAPVTDVAAPKSMLPSNTFSTVRFADLVKQNKISPELAANIAFEYCTEVQAATIDASLSGSDVLARAKTGTGKTLAFLLPSLQNLSLKPLPSKDNVSILIISPTRELAQQIAKEAEILLSGLPYNVQCVVGGTNINSEKRRMTQDRCDVLVATPGRFLDHVRTLGLGEKLTKVQTLILDEADRLLDSGFRNDLISIIQSLPDRTQQLRQTLLFSATVSDEVKKIASLALLAKHDYISTISDDDQNTHEHVKQEFIIAPMSDLFALTAKLLFDCIADSRARGEEEKAIVFLPTARGAGLIYEVISALEPKFPVPVFQIHSRMSQSMRTKVTESFRKAPSAILFSSDVTARGMDFSGVGFVLQVGIPSSGEQYIHRLGRTARAGQEGTGLLILTNEESFFLRKKEIQSLPLVRHPQSENFLGTSLDKWRQSTNIAMTLVSDLAKAQAYSAWLGYYKGFMSRMGMNATQLVASANKYALEILQYRGEGDGLPPGLLAKTVGMMGLRGTPGLNVVRALPDKPGQGNGGRRGGGMSQEDRPGKRRKEH